MSKQALKEVSVMTPRKILFCADFSENSQPAYRSAVDYTKAFGAQLIIAHVIDSSGFPVFVDWVGDELSQILKQTSESANARLKKMAEECHGDLKEVKTVCRLGLAANQIVDLATEENVDLIVVGTHGYTGVKHLVMGSIARSIIKMAHRPVLIVQAPSGGESSEKPYEFPVP
jgi:universal stress protein A